MKFLRVISTLLSPTLMAFYVLIVFSLLSEAKILSALIGFFFLTFIPSFSIYYFSKGSIDYTERKGRWKMYLIALLSYLIASLIFFSLNIHPMFLISLTYFFVAFAICIINFFWKISAHSAGVAGPITALIYVFGLSLLPLYLLVFLVIWCRRKMGIHNLEQLIAGAVVAIFITFLVYKILW